MRIVRRRPWFYILIALLIGTPPSGTVFTYGSTIYSPDLSSLPWDLEVHEREHRDQQGRTPWLWWARYLVDARFRYEQEIAAYRAQLRVFPKAHRAARAAHLATILKSPMYGDGLTFLDAYDALTEEAA